MIQCPLCGSTSYSVALNDECNFCGENVAHTIVSSHHTISPLEQWEAGAEHSFFSSFLKISSAILFHPKKFYSSISHTSSLFHAMVYAIILASIGTTGMILWHYTPHVYSVSLLQRLRFFNVFESNSPIQLLFLPMQVIFMLMISTLYSHGMLKITQKASAPFRATFIGICYTTCSSISLIIPIFGSILYPILSMTLFIFCLSGVHHISKKKIVLVLSVPLLIIGFLFIFFIIAALAGSFVFQTLFKELIPFFR